MNDLNAQLDHNALPDNWGDRDDLIDWLNDLFNSYTYAAAITYDYHIDPNNIDPSVENTLNHDVMAFLSKVDPDTITRYAANHVGHDLWLTQGRYGTGFWAQVAPYGPYSQEDADTFTEAAKTLNEQRYLHVGGFGTLRMS